MHILVVDDEADFLSVIQNRLSKQGFTVTTANSGEEALAKFSATEFAAVILDVKMPGIDGLSVLKEFKKQRPDVGVLLLTGHASVESAIAGVEAGAVDYLIKPVPMNDLVVRLHDIGAKK